MNATLTISPPQIEDSHDGSHSATLTWTSEGADEVQLDGELVAPNGSKVLRGAAVGTHSHTIEAIGRVEKSASYTVIPHTHPPDPDVPPHPDDPDKQAEHLAMLALVTPQSADLYVPKGTTYTINPDPNPSQFPRIRNDGTLVIRGRLRTDTIVCDAGSTLEVHPGSRVTFSDTGPITDPFRLGRGLLSHGKVRILGTPKTSWTYQQPAAAGARQITVDDATGWQIGDRLILAANAVAYANYSYNVVKRDDEVAIQAISGNVVTLDRPLTYDHKAVENQNPAVANLTRSIVFESEGASIDRRGHVMFMHSADVSVRYAAFVNLGRTDKSKQVTDPDGKGGGVANPRGRYSLHCHRAGTESAAIDLAGNVIEGVAGWGLVNHDSNVNADRNVAYDGFGALFVTEIGNEKGTFTNNFAARCDGVGSIPNTLRVNDPGHFGTGFWIEGAGVPLTGNVAIGCRSAGFTFFSMAGAGIVFKNNVGLFSLCSLILWDVGGNGIGSPPFDPVNVVEGNFLHGNIEQGYSSRITYSKNTVVAFDPNISTWGWGHTGVNAHIHHLDNRVVGFKNGVLMPTEGNNVLRGGFYDNLQVNIYIQNTQQSFQRRIDIEGVSFGTRAPLNIAMMADVFAYNTRPARPEGPYMDQQPVPPWEPLFMRPNWALGHPKSEVTLDGAKLYFEEQGAAFEFGKQFTRFPAEIRFEPDGKTLATTASLAKRGLIVGGEPLPEGEQFYLPKVRGVLVK